MIARLATAALFTLNVILAGGICARADSGCTVAILLAQLVAVGRTHHYAEYLIQFAPISHSARTDSGGIVGPTTIRLRAVAKDGTTTILQADRVVVYSPLGRSEASTSLLVVLPTPNVTSFVMDNVGSDPRIGACDPLGRYAMVESYYVAGTTFDDSDEWAKAPKAVPIILDAPRIVYRAIPENVVTPTSSGQVRFAVTIGADGALAGARITQSSGNRRVDDAFLKAERASRFAAAHLPAVYGGTPVASEIFDTYPFVFVVL